MNTIEWQQTSNQYMRKIEAIIRPALLDEVKVALGEIGVTGLSVTDVRGLGSSKSNYDRPYRQFTIAEMPIRCKIEIVTTDEDVDEIVDTILKHARTGEPGDGKVFVLSMDDAIRIRTEERGDMVL